MQAVLEKIIEKLEKEYEDLKEIYKSSKDYSFYHTYQGVNKAIEIVKKEAAEYNNGWIPVSERLPNQYGEFTDVLITCESMSDGVFVQSAEFYIASDGEPVFDALYHYESVLAWKPLPLPYHPNGE